MYLISTSLRHNIVFKRFSLYFKASKEYITAHVDASFQSEGFIIEQNRVKHCETISKQHIKWRKLELKKEVCKADIAVGPCRKRLAEKISYNEQEISQETEYMPSKEACYAFNSRKRAKVRAAAPSHSHQELQNYVLRMTPDREGFTDTSIFVDPNSTINERISIPFTNNFLLDQGKEFLAKNSRVVLVTDFTHDTCFQKYKTGSIGLFGLHFDGSNWRNTQIPLR